MNIEITSYQLLDIQYAAYLPIWSHAVATADTLYRAESVPQTLVETYLPRSFDTWKDYQK
jgi:hypothetical protein